MVLHLGDTAFMIGGTKFAVFAGKSQKNRHNTTLDKNEDEPESQVHDSDVNVGRGLRSYFSLHRISLANPFRWEQLPSMELPHRIAGKNFAVGFNNRSNNASYGRIFVSYSGAIYLDADSTTIPDFHVFNYVNNVQTALRDPSFRRLYASLVAFGDHSIYLMGGITNDPNSDRFIPHVERYDIRNGTWSMTHSLMPVRWCGCGVSVLPSSFMLHGCFICPDPSRSMANRAIFYYPANDSWSQVFPNDPAMTTSGSRGVAIEQFVVTVNPTSGKRKSHTLVMYDIVMNQTSTATVNCLTSPMDTVAAFSSAGYLYIAGGNVLEHMLSVSAETHGTRLLPAVRAQFDEPIYRSFPHGVNATFSTVQSCSSSMLMYRLSRTYDCVDPVAPDRPCREIVVFSTAQIKDPMTAFVCYTRGTCAVPTSERVPCRKAAMEHDCRMLSCCWDTVQQQCYSYGAVNTTTTAPLAIWTPVDLIPVHLGDTVVPRNTNSKQWYETPTFFIICGGAATSLGLVVLGVWHRQARRNEFSDTETSESEPGLFHNTKLRLDDYVMIEKVGAGSYGCVYRATKRVAHRRITQRNSVGGEVAIKVVPCINEQQLQSALREFDLARRFNHPNLIRVLDMFVRWEERKTFTKSSMAPNEVHVNRTDRENAPLLAPHNDDHDRPTQYVCIVTEFHAEGDLRRHIEKYTASNPVPNSLLEAVCLQVCTVLNEMHSRTPPVIHRDLKLENILVSDNGSRFIVTDLGMACFGTDDDDDVITHGGGTAAYSAPEAWNRQYSPATDMWALGCVLYGMATMRIKLGSIRVMFDAVDEPDFEASIRSELTDRDPAFVSVVLQMLRKNPTERITAAEVLDQLFDNNHPGAINDGGAPLPVKGRSSSSKSDEHSLGDS